MDLVKVHIPILLLIVLISPATADSSFQTDISEGWNYISAPIADNSNPEIQNVFDNTEDIETVWTYDNGEWKNYNPDAQENDFDTIKGGRGYILESDDSFTWSPSIHTSISGSSPQEASPASEQLEEGWNLVGHYWTESKNANVSGALRSLKYEDIGSIYHQEQEGNLGLDALNLDEGMKPGKAYWLMVKQSSTYAKTYRSSVDWSKADTYNIGETVETGKYNATISHVEGLKDKKYPNIRNININSVFTNKNVSVSESFEGLDFKNSLVTRSGKVYRNLDDVKGLRENQSSGDGFYYQRNLDLEIPSSEKPLYLRTKVVSEQGIEDTFRYNFTDYTRWKIPDFEAKVRPNTDNFVFINQSANLSVTLEHASYHLNQSKIKGDTNASVYLAKEDALAEELNTSESDWYDHEFRSKIRNADPTNLKSMNKLCGPELNSNLTFSCKLSNISSRETYIALWKIERTDRNRSKNGISRFHTVNLYQVGDKAEKPEYNVELQKAVQTFGDDLETETYVENKDISSLLPEFRIEYESGSTSDHTYVDIAKGENRTYENSFGLRENPRFLRVDVDDKMPIFFNISNVSVDNRRDLPPINSQLKDAFQGNVVLEDGSAELVLEPHQFGGEYMTSKNFSENVAADMYIVSEERYNKVTGNSEDIQDVFSNGGTNLSQLEPKHLCHTNPQNEKLQCELSNLSVPVGHNYKLVWNISRISENQTLRVGDENFQYNKMRDTGETAEFNDYSFTLDHVYLSNQTVNYQLEVGSKIENKNVNNTVAPDGIEPDIEFTKNDGGGIHISGAYSVYQGQEEFTTDTETVSPNLKLDYARVYIDPIDREIFYNLSKQPETLFEFMDQRTYELGEEASNDNLEVNFTGYRQGMSEYGDYQAYANISALNKNLSEVDFNHELLRENGETIGRLYGPELTEGENISTQLDRDIPQGNNASYIFTKFGNGKPLFLFNITADSEK